MAKSNSSLFVWHILVLARNSRTIGSKEILNAKSKTKSCLTNSDKTKIFKMTKFTRVLYSCGKTINLARPQIYQVPRKPPLNSLIFEKLPEPRCAEKITEIPKSAPIKPVRVCTKKELKAMYCPPPICDCTVKTPPLTLFQRLGELNFFFYKI